jgi:hypothetical protein
MSLLTSAESQRSPLGIPIIIHRYIFVGSLVLLVIGMPTSTVLTSIPEIIMAANWLLEGGLIGKMKRLLNNKPAFLLCSFFILHLIGLLYTSSAGMDYGIWDTRTKLPLFLLPLILSTSYSITEKEKKLILLCFMLSVTYVTLYGSYLLFTHQLNDIHEISPYVDAVRLAMMIVLSIFLMMYHVFTHKWSWLSLILIIWSLWFFTFLFIMQSLTEAIVFFVLSVMVLGYHAFSIMKKRKLLTGIIVLLLAGMALGGSVGYLYHLHKKYFSEPAKIDFAKLDVMTDNGYYYSNDTVKYGRENGNYTFLYVCWPELKKGWNERSKISFDSNDLPGNPISYTLIRYMTSKGLRKDAEGVKQLTDQDIHAIEMGMPNYSFSSLTSMPYRIYQVFWELDDYRHGGNPSGHSFTQRLEFWKAASQIIKSHHVTGVGTGGVRIAFSDQYNKMHSQLGERYRLRSHNQWLEIGVAFGITGMLWFFLTLVYPAFKTGKIYTFTYFIFWAILMISICTEDTLETQAGATFYAFFNSFLLFLY